ncbi:MAG: ABC transporter substrate-binding protein [Gaiellaceae bacterium]
MRKRSIAAVVVVAAALAVLTGALAGGGQPGVTSKVITIGGTFPLSGPASSYSPIPVAAKAYFSYFNSQRGAGGRRGVFGRQIDFQYLDDGYNPAQTVQLTRQLVEQSHVFAIFDSLGTEPNLAIRSYLNSKKVPQLYVATGASTFGNDYKRYPWTIGWQASYVAEAAAYGKFIVRKVPQAKIGILFQNDDYGKDLIDGLKAGLGSQQSKIVASEGYEVTAADVSSQIVKLKASGANTLMVFATPKFAIQAYAISAKVGWHPTFFTNTVAATSTILGLATKVSGAAQTNGTITASFYKDPANPALANDPGLKLYRQIMAKYYPSGNVNNSFNIYGMAVAWTMVKTLQGAGKNPTRASLLKAAQSLDYSDNPFLIKGVHVKTSATDYFPVEQIQLTRWNDGAFHTFGGLLKATG